MMSTPDQFPQNRGEQIAKSLSSLLRDIRADKGFRPTQFADEDPMAAQPRTIKRREQVIASHRQVLDTLGLECQATTAGIDLYLDDADKFISYLRTLNSKLSSTTSIALGDLADKLLEPFKFSEVDDKIDSHSAVFLGRIEDIAREYQRIGANEKGELNIHLKDAMAVLNEYVEPMQGKYLADYLRAGLAEILVQPIGKWGPSIWHRRFGVEDYVELWDRALKTLAIMRENGQADVFYTKIIEYLKESISFAIDDVEKTKKRREKDSYLNELEKARNKLGEL